MKTLLKRLGRSVGLLALKAIILIVRLLPLSANLAFGRAFGTFIRVLSPKRYQVALKNLRIAYGDTLTPQERERIAKESFSHFGMFAIETIKFAYMPLSEVERRVPLREEHLAWLADLTQQKRGALLLTGHLGNFQVCARPMKARGYEVVALARAARDRGTTELIGDLRKRLEVEVININRSIKPVLQAMKNNKLVAIVCDQNATDVFVPFFGHPTGTVDGPARMALRMNVPVGIFSCVRDGRGGYSIEDAGSFEPAPSGDETADVVRITTEVNARLEELIRRHPEQWLWFHDRWRSSPGVVDPALGKPARAKSHAR